MYDSLAELYSEWSGAYEISNPAVDVYIAVRTDDRRTLRAISPLRLLALIRLDCRENGVPR